MLGHMLSSHRRRLPDARVNAWVIFCRKFLLILDAQGVPEDSAAGGATAPFRGIRLAANSR
jgi:hypothetical protein